MIKVLLLDDEKLALEYLENIVSWEIYGFQIVGSLTDANQALKVFRKMRPDLVISDVCMYGMDGLDFAAAIREIDQNTHILFLSGYKNFDYVQEAIRLDIDDYILKSDIDEDIFLSKILRIKEKIEKEQQKKQYTESVIFKELFTKNIEEKEYKEMLGETEYIRLHKKYYYMILSQKQVPRFLEQYFPGIRKEKFLDEMTLRTVIGRQTENGDFRSIASFSFSEAEFLTVFEMKGGFVSQKEIYEKFYHLASRIFHEVNHLDGNEYNLLYYPRGCAVRQFGKLYREKGGPFRQCYVKKEPQIMEYELDRVSFPQTEVEAAVSANQIYRAIIDKDYEKEKEYQEALMIAIEQEDPITYLWYLKEIIIALEQAEHALKSVGNGRDFSLAESVNKYDLSKPEDVVNFIQYKFQELHNICQEPQENSYSQSIQKALEYIQKNYGQEDLSTNTVAKQVNLSTSWLSTKFKEEVGIGISDYLTSVRIQRAKQLFDEGDYMIYEVAEKVGFASSQYFSKIFKQMTGLTPNEYKRTT